MFTGTERKGCRGLCGNAQKVAKVTSQFWAEMRRRYYVTPSSYMELIRIYSKMLQEQKNEFMNNRNRLLIVCQSYQKQSRWLGQCRKNWSILVLKLKKKRGLAKTVFFWNYHFWLLKTLVNFLSKFYFCETDMLNKFRFMLCFFLNL